MGKVFPKTHAYYDLLLIVHDDLRKRVKTSRLSLDQHEGITLRLEEYLAIIQRLIKKNNALLPYPGKYHQQKGTYPYTKQPCVGGYHESLYERNEYQQRTASESAVEE